MPITDSEFQNVLKYIELKSRSTGTSFTKVLQDEWDNVQNASVVEAFVEEAELAELKERQSNVADQAVRIGAEITRLENKGRGRGQN